MMQERKRERKMQILHCTGVNVHTIVINIMEGHEIYLVSEIKEQNGQRLTPRKTLIVGKTDVYLW